MEGIAGGFAPTFAGADVRAAIPMAMAGGGPAQGRRKIAIPKKVSAGLPQGARSVLSGAVALLAAEVDALRHQQLTPGAAKRAIAKAAKTIAKG